MTKQQYKIFTAVRKYKKLGKVLEATKVGDYIKLQETVGADRAANRRHPSTVYGPTRPLVQTIYCTALFFTFRRTSKTMISPFFRRLISAVLPCSSMARTASITSSGNVRSPPPGFLQNRNKSVSSVKTPRSCENNLCVLCGSLPRFYGKPARACLGGE